MNDDVIEFFEDNVWLIFEEYCFLCYGEDEINGGFNIMFWDGLMEGGDFGFVIDFEFLEVSFLFEVFNYESFEMLFGGKFVDEDIVMI